MADKENIEYSGDAIADMSLGIKKRGMMKSDAYAADLHGRGPETPENVGTDEKIMRIAKGQGVKLFENPQELATSLTGFENWCHQKNIVPSYAAIATYLSCSKATVLKYMKDTTQYSIYILYDNIERKNIYSTTNKDYLDKYISTHNVVERDNATGKNVTYSIQDKLDNGEYKIIYTSTSFAEVMEPACNLIELITTNKAWSMRNPSWPIWLSKNKFGATEQFTDTQTIAVQPVNALDDLDDAAIKRLAEGRPDDA